MVDLCQIFLSVAQFKLVACFAARKSWVGQRFAKCGAIVVGLYGRESIAGFNWPRMKYVVRVRLN